MKKLLFIIPFLVSCVAQKPAASTPKKAIMARVTYYHRHEDKWGDRVAASSQIRNKAGYGVAAHPDFPFWTKIHIPELKGLLDNDDEFTVIDRGSAVTRKTASRGKCYVFDVYTPFVGKDFKKFVAKRSSYTTVVIP